MTDDNVEDIVRSVLRHRLSPRVKEYDMLVDSSCLPITGKKLQLILGRDGVISEVDFDE